MNGSLLLSIYAFVLVAFLGYELLTKVPPMLHTPLMSGSNALSGITILGALSLTGSANGVTATVLATAALVLATVNVVGGFLVTDRMLTSFTVKKKVQS